MNQEDSRTLPCIVPVRNSACHLDQVSFRKSNFKLVSTSSVCPGKAIGDSNLLPSKAVSASSVHTGKPMNDKNFSPSKTVGASPVSSGKLICGSNFSLSKSVSGSFFCPNNSIIGSNVLSSKTISGRSLFSRKPNYDGSVHGSKPIRAINGRTSKLICTSNV